jgi:hypothetical protein
MDQNSNPLKQFFRQPSIYIRLPSQGQFWEPGSIDMPRNGEVPVLPMTAIDEMTYRTPDALFNGQAVVSVIESCIPCIKDAWQCPTIDLDTILIAIRLASFGHEMQIDTVCPHCSNSEEYGVDLRNVLDNLKAADYTQNIINGDLEIYFRPLTYRQTTDNTLRQFEEQKVLNVIPDVEMEDREKLSRLNAALSNLTKLTIETLAQTISLVKTPNATVSESEYITEWLANAPSSIFDRIKDHVIGLREVSEIKPLTINCVQCQQTFEQSITLDQAFFFGDAS